MAPVSLGRVTTEEARGFSPGALMRVRPGDLGGLETERLTSQKRTITRYLSVDFKVRRYLRTSPTHFKRLRRRVVILARIIHSRGTGSGEPLAALSGLRELRASQGELWAAKHSPPNQVELPPSPIFETPGRIGGGVGPGKACLYAGARGICDHESLEIMEDTELLCDEPYWSGANVARLGCVPPVGPKTPKLSRTGPGFEGSPVQQPHILPRPAEGLFLAAGGDNI